MTLEKYLSDKRLSRAAFAAQIDSTQQSVGRWINGRRIPSPDVLRRIHQATNGKVSRKDFVDEFGAPLVKER